MSSEVTRILTQIEAGDPSAPEQLLPLVYDELRKLAAAKMMVENPGQTLQATALVHEAYLRLASVEEAQHFDNRGHFFAAAAEAMLRILVENARRKNRVKHGGRAGAAGAGRCAGECTRDSRRSGLYSGSRWNPASIWIHPDLSNPLSQPQMEVPRSWRGPRTHPPISADSAHPAPVSRLNPAPKWSRHTNGSSPSSRHSPVNW
jgi:hypothetical protein